MGSRLLNAPIVLDNGSGTIRAGFAGQDLPKCYFPSFVGRPKHVRALAGALEGDVFIGLRAEELRGLLKINYPLEHGIVTDWDDMERIWQYVYTEELKTVSEDVSIASGYSDRWSTVERSIGDWLILGFVASSAAHRTSAQPAAKSRLRRTNSFRDIQCSCSIYIDTSSPITIRIRENNRHRSRCWRRSFTCSASVRRVRNTKQHTADRCRWQRRDGAHANITEKSGIRLPHECGEGDCEEDQGDHILRGA